MDRHPSLLNQAPSLLILGAIVLTLRAHDAGVPFVFSLVVGDLFLCGVLLLSEGRWDRRRVTFVAALLITSATLSGYALWKIRRAEPLPERLDGDFTVTERRAWGDSEILRLKSRDGREWSLPVDDALIDAREGDRFALKASVTPFHTSTARSDFHPLRYWRSRGVYGELKVSSVRSLERKFSLHSFRQMLRERLQRLPYASRSLISAILLGDRPPELNLDFKRWGISHILAVSGWHVGIALIVGVFIFGPGRNGLLPCSALVWAYCFLSGASLSALRAALVLQVMLLALRCGRSSTVANSVGVAGVLMVLWNPWVVYDIAWQLSVLCTVLVGALFTCVKEFSIVLTGPVLWAVTSPIVAPLMGEISLSAPFINVMATTIFPWILAVVLIGSIPTLLGFSTTVFTLPGEMLFYDWTALADQWVEWFPWGLPSNFFPFWLSGGAVFFLTALGQHIPLWRCALLALAGGILAAVFL